MASSSALPLSSGGLPPRSTLRRIAILDVVAPFLAIMALLHNGVPPLTAYAAASIFPASSIVFSWFERRSADVVGIGVLVGIASSLLLALLTNDPRFGLVRAAPSFAMFGIACFISLATRRPLMFFVARAIATGGDGARIAAFDARLAVPAFRRVMRHLTFVWGAGTLTHAAYGLAVAFLLPAGVAVLAEPPLAVAIIAALLLWTRAVQRRSANPAL